MGNALLASKIVTREEEPSLRAIPATKTAVIAAIGVSEKGPIGVPTLCQSWEDYVKTFGGFITVGDLPLAVWGIYRQDPGAWVYVTRTVHYTDLITPIHTAAAASVTINGSTVVASAGAITGTAQAPINLFPGAFLDIHVDEDGGGPEQVVWDAAQAVRAGSGLSITDIDTETLIVSIDGGENQTCTFTATHVGDPDGAAAEINAQLVGCSAVVNTGEIDLASDTFGTDSSVEVVGGTAIAELGHSTGTTTEATSDVANINAVTLAEIQARIAFDIVTATVTVTQEGTGEITITSDTTGASSSVQIEASSDADAAFGFDNTLHSGSASSSVASLTVSGLYEGTYLESLRPTVEAASNGDATYFNLLLKTAEGVTLETFPNCQSADDAADDFVEAVVAAVTSQRIAVTDLGSGVRPDDGSYTPTGGDDGLTSLDANDFLGDIAGGTGIHAFDTIEEITILVAPAQWGAALHNGLVTYCEVDRDGLVFPVLATPPSMTQTEIVTYVVTTATLKNSSEHGAIYWPEIKVTNPNKTIYGTADTVTVDPSAWVAGVMSRVDDAREGGIYDPPAGIERGKIVSLLGFENDNVLREPVRDLIYPERINPISALKNHGRFIDGLYTLKGTSNFPTIAERRGVSYIQRSVKDGTQFARHSNNDESLRARVFRTVFNFLRNQMKLGAFRTKDPATAFFVDVSDALNPPSEQFLLKLNGRIGLATQKPAEFVVWAFAQDTRALEEEIAG
jgi:hypothetical protein